MLHTVNIQGFTCKYAPANHQFFIGFREVRHHFRGSYSISRKTVDQRAGHLIANNLKSTTRNRAARDGHERLVERVAVEMQRAGRIAWRGLSLRAGLPQDDGRMLWVNAMPDVYSIRHSTVEDYLEPAVHEVKVSRADLLGELRRPPKSAAYRALCGQCWFVIKAGIAEPEEIPFDYGVLIGHDSHLELARPAPKRACKPDFATWMALARATPLPPPEDAQSPLA